MSTFLREHAWQIAALAVVLAVVLLRTQVTELWDLDIYYYGALADQHGLTPYDVHSLNAVATGPLHYLLPYGYPPLTLWLFKPFTALPLAKAKVIWLGVELAGLAALVLLWQVKFISRRHWAGWVLIALLGFNSTIVRDMRSGNFELFIQLFIWLAVVAYLARRWAIFCGLIVLAAFFKAAPILLLGLLLVAPTPKRWHYLAGALAAFALLLGLSYLSAPAQFLEWAGNVAQHDEEMGMRNPCTLAFFREFALYFSTPEGLELALRKARLAWLVVAAAIGLLSLRTLWRGRHEPLTDEREKLLVFATLATYALVVPRFMVYSYVLLLVPAWFIAIRRRWGLPVFLALFALHDVADKLLGQAQIDPASPFWREAAPLTLLGVWFGYLVVNYFSLFLAAGVWELYRRELEPSTQREAAPVLTAGSGANLANPDKNKFSRSG